MTQSNSSQSLPSVSVLMPVYNPREDWLNEAIESILSQTHGAFELVIVDDCSNAETQAILSNWANKDSRIRVIRNEQNLGIAAALNRGLATCQYPLVARMDADDIAHPTRLEKQVEFLIEHPDVDIVGSNIQLFGRYTHLQVYPEHHETIKQELLFANQLAHPVVLYKRDKILEMGGYSTEIPFAEDYDLWTTVALKGLKLHNLQDTLLSYRTQTGREDYDRRQRHSAFRVRMNYICQMLGLSEKISPESSIKAKLKFFINLSQSGAGKIQPKQLHEIKYRLIKETVKHQVPRFLFKALLAFKVL